MRNGAVARHAIGRLVRVGLEPGHQLLEVLGADRRAGDHAELEARELRDRHEILRRIEARHRLHHRQQVHGRTGGHQDGGAVGIGAHDRLDPDQPVAAGAVLDDDIAIEQRADMLRQRSGRARRRRRRPRTERRFLSAARIGRTHRPLLADNARPAHPAMKLRRSMFPSPADDFGPLHQTRLDQSPAFGGNSRSRRNVDDHSTDARTLLPRVTLGHASFPRKAVRFSLPNAKILENNPMHSNKGSAGMDRLWRAKNILTRRANHRHISSIQLRRSSYARAYRRRVRRDDDAF